MSFYFSFFFFNDTATTEIYTLSLHDALPILLDRHCRGRTPGRQHPAPGACHAQTTPGIRRFLTMSFAALAERQDAVRLDRKSTRLNSSHLGISYAVFCLKKKIKKLT